MILITLIFLNLLLLGGAVREVFLCYSILFQGKTGFFLIERFTIFLSDLFVGNKNTARLKQIYQKRKKNRTNIAIELLAGLFALAYGVSNIITIIRDLMQLQ